MPAHLGTVVSPGIRIGPAYQFAHDSLEFRRFEPADASSEWARFEAALSAAGQKLQIAYEKAARELGTDDAAIFQAHLTILHDPDLLAGTKDKIFEQRTNAEAAIFDVSELYCQQLEAIEDEYIRARAADIRDVRNAILARLLAREEDLARGPRSPAIVISRFLTPSDCIAMDSSMILGFCTMEGGATSHVAILARSLGVPAIAGMDEAVLTIPEGTILILDGENGKLLHDVDAAVHATFEAKRREREEQRTTAMKDARLPAVTQDGHRVHVFVNLGTADPDTLESSIRNGAEGVGLLRTEFVYLECSRMPDEELQYRKYRTVADAFGERPVILRTIDIGGDKELPYLPMPNELNPFLGVRGLRLSLSHPALFKTQLKAALRAGHGRNLLLMYPMVTKASEIRSAQDVLAEAARELTAEGVLFADKIEIGIMVEVPAAALLADQLANEVDFFSIGTNDLSQYTLAMDRTNAQLSRQVDALDPSVLRLIAGVIQASHRKGKKTGVCGELAGDPLAIPVLLGLELDEFSMNAPAIPTAKRIIRRLKMNEARELARSALELEAAEQVRELVRQSLPDLADDFRA